MSFFLSIYISICLCVLLFMLAYTCPVIQTVSNYTWCLNQFIEVYFIWRHWNCPLSQSYLAQHSITKLKQQVSFPLFCTWMMFDSTLAHRPTSVYLCLPLPTSAYLFRQNRSLTHLVAVKTLIPRWKHFQLKIFLSSKTTRSRQISQLIRWTVTIESNFQDTAAPLWNTVPVCSPRRNSS